MSTAVPDALYDIGRRLSDAVIRDIMDDEDVKFLTAIDPTPHGAVNAVFNVRGPRMVREFGDACRAAVARSRDREHAALRGLPPLGRAFWSRYETHIVSRIANIEFVPMQGEFFRYGHAETDAATDAELAARLVAAKTAREKVDAVFDVRGEALLAETRDRVADALERSRLRDAVFRDASHANPAWTAARRRHDIIGAH